MKVFVAHTATISVRILTRNTLQSGIINLTKDGPTEPGYYRPIITSSGTPMTGGVCKEKFGFPFPVLSPTVSHIRYLATNNNTQSQCDVFNGKNRGKPWLHSYDKAVTYILCTTYDTSHI